MPIPAGTRLGSYEIIELIGAGGMGEVYRARDARLRREVAVKVLSPALACDEERLTRFEREARAASALNHPNIVTVHDFGETDLGSGKLCFMAMELVRGETLRSCLAGTAKLDDRIDWLTQIAVALRKAHDAGIVHRDLKPENVIVSEDGFVKVLDFGLAKLIPPAEMETHPDAATTRRLVTETGIAVGTIGYMSPEQVEARPVDHRSDIFSFGCVAYEALSGRRAFDGSSAVDTLHRIVHDPPPPLDGVAPELQGIVMKCLAKRREERYQSMGDVAADLRAFGRGGASHSPILPPRRHVAVTAAIVVAVAGLATYGWRTTRPVTAPSLTAVAVTKTPMIVVLPFENLGGADSAVFAAGMTDEITTRLASMSALRVISPTTAARYRDRKLPLRRLGEDLDVEYVLEGTVRWDRTGAPPRVRVSPRLTRVSDDVHLWAESFDEPLEDVFGVQSRIAEQVAGALNVRLLERERNAIRGVPTSSLAAYEAYLGAVQSVHDTLFTPEHQRRTIAEFRRAVELDPSFAAAWAWLSVSESYAYYAGMERTPQKLGQARQAAERALQLDPNLAASHFAMGMHFWWDLTDTETAMKHLRRAAELAPSDADVWQAMGQIAHYRGRYLEAEEHLARAEKLNPYSVNVVGDNFNLAVVLRRYERAFQLADRMIALTSGSATAHYQKFMLLVVWKGPGEEMRQLVREHLSGTEDEAVRARLHLQVLERRYDDALRTLREAGEDSVRYLWLPISAPVSLIEADIYRLAGRESEAKRACEQARDELRVRQQKNPGDKRTVELLRITAVWLGERGAAVDRTDAVQMLDAGDRDGAIRALEASLAKPGYTSKTFVRADPHFDPLRDDRRFRRLVEGDDRLPR